MDLARKKVILGNILQALEDAYEGCMIELSISVKVKDVEGVEVLKKRAIELEAKIAAAKELQAGQEKEATDAGS